MSRRIVATQAELDAAIYERVDVIEVRSDPGVWLRLVDNKSSSVEARGSSRVEAWGSSSVEAWESSSVEAWGSSSVVARGSSRVVARGSSSVVARESSRVEAWGSSRVEAWGSSSVEASKFVAVHLHNATATVKGGVLIDVSKPLTDPADWCDYHGVKVTRGVATLYKAVDDEWTTPRGFDYSPGKKPIATDWRADNSCGGGIHLGPTPRHAKDYHYEATRFVEVGVKLADMRPILDGGTAKVKARAVHRACVEVTIDGERVTK